MAMKTNQPNTPSPNDTTGQKLALLNHVKKIGSITGLQAIILYGCIGYSQRFGELRRAGIPIQSRFITTATGKRVKQYWLEPSYINQHKEKTA